RSLKIFRYLYCIVSSGFPHFHMLHLRMSFCYPSSPRKLAMTVAFFASGAALFAAGIHLSYLNVAPQQARTKARNDFVKERLRQKQGK
ncbi:unnamed protein product, partial [Brassica rapa]